MEGKTGEERSERFESDEKSLVIKTHNAVISEININDIILVKDLLTFKSFFWKQGKYKRERIEYNKCLVNKEGIFYTGLIPYIKKNFDGKINIIDENKLEDLYKRSIDEPLLKNITFRTDQKRILDNAIKKRRGIIISPTASGKGLLICGLVSAFKKNHNILVLVHNKSLLKQISEDFTRFGFKHTIMYGEEKEGLSPITIATIQTFSRLREEDYSSYYDVVIQDELHHTSSFSTIYAKTLLKMVAPYRFGLTATVRTDKESTLVYNSVFGELIDEVTMDEGIEKGFIAKPKLKIMKTSYDHQINTLRRYPDVYDEGVIHNEERNQMIADFVIEQNKAGKTCMILVNKIAHGIILKHLIPESSFVRGTTETEARESIKKDLNNKNIHCVIATTVFKEGINIPTLDIVINAGGGKSEIATLQAIGRGLRVTDTKKDVLLVDVYDCSHNYLIAHFGERLVLYSDKGWL